VKQNPFRFFIFSCFILFSCGDKKQEAVPPATTANIPEIVSKPAETEIKFETYCNKNFAYCIDFPSEILFPQGESDSGDGQWFKSKDGESTLAAYRDLRDNMDIKAFELSKAYQEDSRANDPEKPNRVVTYKKLNKDNYVVSGYDDGKIFYQKTIISDGMLATSILHYREKDSFIFNKISERVFKSFK
jgi:hypothetical protein